MKIKFNHCKACGFPMTDIGDYGGKNKKNSWCINCCYENGEHKNFDLLVKEMSIFLLTREGEYISNKKFKNIEESKKFAQAYLKKQPAFKEKN